MTKKQHGSTGGRVYLRHTQGGHSYITEHSCWDAKLFIARQFESNASVNAKREKGQAAILLEEVTELDYMEARNAKTTA